MSSRIALWVAVLTLWIGCGDEPPEPAPADTGPADEPPPASARADAGFVCHTTKHRVQVDASQTEVRYRSWKAGAPADAAPDLEIGGGSSSTEGSGACRLVTWTFASGGATFEVQQGGCGDPDDTAEAAPGDGTWTGRLRVMRGDAILSNRRCGATAAAPSAQVPPTVRATTEGDHGTSRYGSWRIEWGPGRATATGDQGVRVVLYKDSEETDGDFHTKLTHRILSVVGPYVSYAVEFYTDGGAHPTYGTIWKVADVRDPGREVDLRELVGAAPIHRAMKADKKLQRALRGGNPADLTALLATLDGGCTMALGPTMTKAFAFHHLVGDQVAVRLGIGHGCEVERGTFTEIELLVPIGDLMPMIIPAAAAGTLMEDFLTK
jgi:hypothetical protein